MTEIIIEKATPHWKSEIRECEELYFPADIAFPIKEIETDIHCGNCYLIRDEKYNLIAYFVFEEMEKIVYLSNIVVISKYRKKGIAQFILNYLCIVTKFKGYKTIGLHVTKDNPTAKRLYSKFGFVTEYPEKIKNYYYDYPSDYMEFSI